MSLLLLLPSGVFFGWSRFCLVAMASGLTISLAINRTILIGGKIAVEMTK